ncbi:UDP-galactose transporter 1 [Citrus sinensis]|nr:UDP-galactose transporter 1 [Citrus sinensis]
MEASLCTWSVFRSLLAILQWWVFNVTVIITNKWIFQKLDFKFPLSVSCIHFICSSIGAYLVIKVLKLKPLITVEPEDRWRRIFPMSFVFCINIVLGNWLVWRKYFDWRIWASLVPIVGGILLTSVTELSFNMFGFCAALFGCLATSTKTILAESLLHSYKFDSSGVLAFCLNFSIFYVIHSTTAVTFNVAGNLKVAVAVLVSWLIFRNPISGMNAVGCAITLIGCTFYGYIRHLLSQQPPPVSTPSNLKRDKLKEDSRSSSDEEMETWTLFRD